MAISVMETVKLIKGLAGEEKDQVITFAIQKATDDIKNYCQILELPPGLESTVVSMAIDILDQSESLKSDKELADGRIESIKEGDTTVTLQSASAHYKAIASTPSFAKNYKAVLNVYRKVAFDGWT